MAYTNDISGWTIAPEDDLFHDHFEGSDHPWWTESFWTSFNVPERKMGGWFYSQVKKNQGEHGVNFGGAWIWDPSGMRYQRRGDFPMPPGPRDLRDIALPNGNVIKQLVPNMKYHMTYFDKGKLESDLIFEGVIPPTPHPVGAFPFWRGRHFDQPMHVKGEIVLDGERIAIDCVSYRDRTWSPRPPARKREDGNLEAAKPAPAPQEGPSDVNKPLRKPYNLGYLCCGKSAQDSFVIFTALIQGEEDRGDFVTGGSYVKDGVWAHVVKGERRCLVDPDTNYIWRIEFEGEDSLGRRIELTGEQFGQDISTNSGLFLFKWDGKEAWGENQGGTAPSYPRVKRG